MFVYVEKYNEEYAISLPELYLRGIVTGAPFVEITGETLIVCSNHQIAAKLRFIPKPWFSGEYNLVEGIIYDDADKDIKYEIWGKWSETVWIQSKDEDPEESHLANIETGIIDEDPNSKILFDATKMIAQAPKLHKDQSPLESRQVWKDITNALINGEHELASRKKNEVEDRERAKRKERAANGIQWLPMTFGYIDKFFLTRQQDNDLAHIISANLSTESLIRIRNLSMDSPSVSDQNSDTSSPSAVSTEDLEKQAVRKIKFNGRWVSYEFLDYFEKKSANI